MAYPESQVISTQSSDHKIGAFLCKDYLLSFPGNSIVYDRQIHFEQLEKARSIEGGSAGLAASHINNRAFEDIVIQAKPVVNKESMEAMDVEVDESKEKSDVKD